jgi:hypothetical protein
VTPEQLHQLLEAHAPTLRSLRLGMKEYGPQVDLTTVSWTTARPASTSSSSARPRLPG